MPVFCNISVHKNLSEKSGIVNVHLTSFWFQLLAVLDISVSLINYIFVSAVPRWRIHWWLPTYQVHSCHLYSLLWLFWDTTIYSRRATAGKPLWKLCRPVAMKWEMLCYCLSCVWTNPTGGQIPCMVLSCLSMQEERWDCVLFSRSTWDSSVITFVQHIEPKSSTHLIHLMKFWCPLGTLFRIFL